MLLTVLRIGTDRYALDAAQIVEVLPLLEIRAVPHASPAVAGICNFRGTPTTVVDLNRLAGRESAPALLSTRILLLRHQQARFALLAGGVTETIKVAATDFIPAPPDRQQRPWLGPLARWDRAFIQRIEIEPLAREAGVLP